MEEIVPCGVMSTRSTSLLLSAANGPPSGAPRAPRGASASASAAALSRSSRSHKERSKNFSELEKKTVLELIAQHRDVLRQGRANSATNKSKQLVWSAICSEVNKRCHSERPRTPAQVKMWYENYKKKCKMRGGSEQPDGNGLLDGLLWQSLHSHGDSVTIKEEVNDRTESPLSAIASNEQLPVNMSNGRSRSDSENSTCANPLEPHVQMLQASPGSEMAPSPSLRLPKAAVSPPAVHRLPSPLPPAEDNQPLNLSHPDDRSSVCEEQLFGGRSVPSDAMLNGRFPERADPDWSGEECARKRRCGPPREAPTEEERRYFAARRLQAAAEHEARMRILSLELRHKEEMYNMQKQLFLLELKMKMDLLQPK